MAKKMMPENQPSSAARFQEAPCHTQNSAAVPNGTIHAAPIFGNTAASATAAAAATITSRTSEEGMIRRLGFSLVLVTAFMVVACGRQVTPNPPGLGAGGANPGFMVVKLDVNAPFDFSSYQYWVVFNTTGNGLSPDTNPARNNYAAFSDAVQVGGAGGGT